jgi:hypothetical protein
MTQTKEDDLREQEVACFKKIAKVLEEQSEDQCGQLDEIKDKINELTIAVEDLTSVIKAIGWLKASDWLDRHPHDKSLSVDERLKKEKELFRPFV